MSEKKRYVACSPFVNEDNSPYKYRQVNYKQIAAASSSPSVLTRASQDSQPPFCVECAEDFHGAKVVLCMLLKTTVSCSSEPAGGGARRTGSGEPAGPLLPRGWVYESSALPRSPRAHPREAWVAFAYNLCWMFATSESVSPRTLLQPSVPCAGSV